MQISFLTLNPGKKFPWQKRLKPLAKAMLKKENKNSPVNIILCNDAKQRELNFTYRKIDHVTDVLSFVWNEPDLLGEIYIAKGQVQKQAPVYGNSYYGELKRVLVHGILHLCGYDHCSPAERRIMRAKEQFFLGENPYI